MRTKFLLFVFLLWGSMASAQNYYHQDTINTLVITEYRGDNTYRAYLELTNMGDEPVQLGQFKIGNWGSISKLDLSTGKTNASSVWIPLDTLLPPGKSYVFASFGDYNPKMFAKGLEDFQEKMSQDKMLEYADFIVHLDEGGDSINDLVTPDLEDPFSNQWGPGMNGFFIQQMFAYGEGDNTVYDSIVVDQVNGMFIDADGTHPARGDGSGFDVAGITEATGNSYLIRKHNVKKGNLDFNNARGVGIDDSEWIPIPFHGAAWRDPLWTVGSQGDFNLDANTLESGVIDVDFTNKTLTLPWGIKRGDDIMNYFVKKPGIGWEYLVGAGADSLTHAAQTGDILRIYVCGNDMDVADFAIVVNEPASDAKMIVPVSNQDPAGNWRNIIENGIMDWPRITTNGTGMDTIWGVRGGIPYATRVDSLLKRLEKPSNAKWEVVYASGVEKPDINNGDKLKITAHDGSEKEYYISVRAYRKNTDATLSSITWPDIPEFYKDLFGWIGDTIPGFGSGVYNYNIEVPLEAEGIPAFVAKTNNPNARVDVKRATSLSGSVDDRTVKFTVTAEDDTTKITYSIVLTKQKNPADLQPYAAEPFISELLVDLFGTWAFEICNPGNLPLDLSNYMITCTDDLDPAANIRTTNEGNWLDRYEKYIPGYKWAANAVDWSVGQYYAQLDLAVNAIVQPGDVFLMAGVSNHNNYCDPRYHFTDLEIDVQFNNATSSCRSWKNQWGEEIDFSDGLPFSTRDMLICLWKIENDSVKQGLKPATDPNDFQLIDVMGKTEDDNWTIPGMGGPGFTQHTSDLRRRPEVYKGNPEVGVSFGQRLEDDVEWNYYRHDVTPNWTRWDNTNDIGTHYFNTPTQYLSTVSSVVYKVSEGYQSVPPQTIKGVTIGTTVAGFLNNIIKKDINQSLKLTSVSDGAELSMDDLVSLNDTLTVLSADSTNTTKYILTVMEGGLSSNAVLTSNRYEITIEKQPKNSALNQAEQGSGTIAGLEYGTSLKTVVNNLIVPEGATLTIIDEQGAPIPYKMLNFDTAYVNVTVNPDIYFEVQAENGITSIMYRLLPTSSENDAFVLSDIYSVSQKELLIKFVPSGTNVQSLFANLVPSFGSSMQLVDKWGFERTEGTVADDDKVVVTSVNKSKSTVYYISKLATAYTPNTTYLAYILSNIYSIDQVEYTIYNVSGNETISNFYNKIRAAAGATAIVVDNNGVEKTSGDINGSDMVKVTSADGKVVVMYSFGVLTGAEKWYSGQIELFPNPTDGRLNVTGLEKGQRIQVYNSVGLSVADINVENNHEIINLNSQPAGMYMIVVSDKNGLLGKYKSIKY